ncbi:MAG TPA: glycosyltransferase [Polyangiaceae bacterium]|nr:glycosyltransferase [Polyangiaceae bacterium]
MRVALVHDWLTGMRGGEYVFEAMAALFPNPELFTLLYVPGTVSERLAGLKRHTSVLQRVPSASKRYRHFLPFMPRLIEKFDLRGFDLVISSSHCVAKGVRKEPGSVHVSYVHAPMRYMWFRFEDYFGPGRASPAVRLAAHAVRPYLQHWDRSVSSRERVDAIVANSRFIAQQVEKAYDRQAEVVHPFADLSRFTRPRTPGDKYLMVGAFAPNKRTDLAIEAFNRLKLPLVIVGQGQDENRLRRMAGPSIEFTGPLPNSAIDTLYSSCKAFIFPGLEDFGITPLEAMASGLPVIGYGEGGATETVVDGKSGILFRPQTVDGLIDAIRRFERTQFDEREVRARAKKFTRTEFQRRFAGVVRRAWSNAGKNPRTLDNALAHFEPARMASLAY